MENHIENGPCIVDLALKDGDVPLLCKRLPEGNHVGIMTTNLWINYPLVIEHSNGNTLCIGDVPS